MFWFLVYVFLLQGNDSIPAEIPDPKAKKVSQLSLKYTVQGCKDGR